MVLGNLTTLIVKVAAAIVIFLLGAFFGLFLLKLYDALYPPIQVICWYCNEPSTLKARGVETESRWYCRKCENLNVRDENGDIVDEFPEMYSAKANRPVLPRRDLSQRFQSDVLCDDCVRKQQIIYNEASHYVKDESDPDYKLSLQVANWQREDLEEQYPLCEDCANKVEQVLREKNIPAPRKIEEEDNSWIDLIPDPEPVRLAQKPSFAFATLSRTKGLLWHISHLTSLIVYSIAIWNPDVIQMYFSKSGHVPFPLPFGSLKEFGWEYWQYWTVFSLASVYWMDWEPLTLRWYGHDRVQLHNFAQYKIAQRIVFIFRLLTPLLIVSSTNSVHIKWIGMASLPISIVLLAYGMLKLRISFIERPARAITGRSATKTKLLVRETSELQRIKPAWQPMKLARQLREAVVRYVPAIEFYGLNGFGWSDDIFEPNPPPNDDFVRKNARVLMEELKDVEYATESDDDSGSDDNITSTLSWRPRPTKQFKRRNFIRPSPLTTKSEAVATKQLSPTPNVPRHKSKRRLPLNVLDSDSDDEKDASDSDDDLGRSFVPWRPHKAKVEKPQKKGLFERMQVRGSSAPPRQTGYSSQMAF
ncbi:hypothetical protein VKS41_003762 [Umbelopsis sp. WA50703]